MAAVHFLPILHLPGRSISETESHSCAPSVLTSATDSNKTSSVNLAAVHGFGVS